MSESQPRPSYEDRRSERRIRVHLPIQVRGTDRSGVRFEERTLSEDVCRKGVAFTLSRELELGANLEITILLPARGREEKKDFATQGLVRHIMSQEGGRIIGAEFIGPHFHRVFLSESADAV